MKIIYKGILSILLVAFSTNILLAQKSKREYYNMHLSSVYTDMLEAVKVEKWDKLETGLKILLSRTNEIEKQLATSFRAAKELKRAIRKRDKGKAKSAIIDYIEGSVEAYVMSARASHNSKLYKAIVRTAFMESIVLDSFRSNEEILANQNRFIRLYRSWKNKW